MNFPLMLCQVTERFILQFFNIQVGNTYLLRKPHTDPENGKMLCLYDT